MTSDHQHEKEIDEVTGVDTTGHDWDGIKELNNPLPRWWLIIFYISIFWSVIYWVFMPAWPGLTGHTRGIRDHSERANVEAAIADLKAARAENAELLLSAPSLREIEGDPQLLQFAMASGESAFGDNCATCHGVGGSGFKGYPNLNDDVWLWGGSLEEIRQTITFGIRSSHPETRTSVMPSYGKDGILNAGQVSDVVNYVLSLSDSDRVGEAVTRGSEIFASQCAVCHSSDGTGNRDFGAPDLTDAEWLYGDSFDDVRDTVYYARNGVMPNWDERLDETTIASLAVYVHTLGGGE